MPIPAYIICSQSSSVDATTKQLSLFHIVDTIRVHKLEDGSEPRGMPVRVTAAWLREPGEGNPGDNYEYQIAVGFPEDDAADVIGSGVFVFSKPIHRITCNGKLAVFPALGVLRFLARIRKQGDTAWIEQSFPVLVSTSSD